MFKHLAPQAAAFGLSAVFTLAVLASLNQLASPPAADSLFANAGAAAQVLVVEGKHLPKA